jgi:hypothetical protein
MKIAEPKDLMDVLARLEDVRQHPGVEAQRRYRRFTVRGEATLEPMAGPALEDPLTVLLRDISRGGAGFLCDRFIEPCSTWRLRFQAKRQIIGSQPVMVRFCRLVQENLYIVGGQFIVEPYIMESLGVAEEMLDQDEMVRYNQHDVSAFVAPDDGQIG